ncbi:MAG: lamin tail domain-containing protein, partial [Ferruginibacter sp.]|nr:lamin tail domain-containing protein [Ferruginibacter sp.]
MISSPFKKIISFAFLVSFFVICSQRSISQVVINEVSHYPITAQGMISAGTEYIELYNAGCSPVDISCYIVGTASIPNSNPGSSLRTGGSIIIPQGTVIQPKSHFVIGTSSSSSDPLAVDYKTDLNTSNYCTTGNFVLANGDGWVALYDASGVPVDAIYWTVSAGQSNKISSDDDLDDSPCIPSIVGTCSTSGIASLASAKQIFENTPSKIFYVGQSNVTSAIPPTATGKTFSRIPDGGAWQRDKDGSINGNNCNGGACASATVPTFDSIDPLCLNSTPPVLPLQSTNGINGIWIPSTIATNTEGTTTYTFTPNGTGCASVVTIDILVETTSATASLVSAPGTDNQTIPANTPIVPITYNFSVLG